MNTILVYSYFLFAINGKSINQGTAFFVEKNEQLYLVTASHNFHTDKTSKSKTSDFFYIRLITKKENKTEFIKIENNPIKLEENIDLSFYKVSFQKEYFISKIKLKEEKVKISNNILCYGFAVVDGNEDNFQKYIETLKPTVFRGLLQRDYDKPIIYLETKEKDYDNYVVKYKSETLGRGTSGAPVFFKKVNKNGEYIYQFGGLIHIRNETDKIARILRPEKIIEHFNKL